MNPREIEATLAAMEQNIAAIRAVRDEIKATIEALRALKENESGLFNVGGGVLVPAKMEGDKVFVSVGAGVALHVDVDKAIEILKKRLEAAEKALERAVKERNAFIEKLRQMQSRKSESNAGRP